MFSSHCSSTKSDALGMGMSHIPMYQAGHWHLLTEVPLAQAQIILYTGLLVPLTHIIRKLGTTYISLEIFLLFPPEILPSDHYLLGFKTSCSSTIPQEFTCLLAIICSIFQPSLENKPNITQITHINRHCFQMLQRATPTFPVN